MKNCLTEWTSTRYIDYEDKIFSYIIPHSISSNSEGMSIYLDAMDGIQENLRKLSALTNIG